MNRIELTDDSGNYYCVVCVLKDVTDEEILAYCNENWPRDDGQKWGEVVRNYRIESPRQCTHGIAVKDRADRLHYLVLGSLEPCILYP